MKNRLSALWKRIQPHFWQELSRVSAICVFAGWITLYYHRYAEVEAGLFATWLFTTITLVLAAAFGSFYKHSHQNQRNLFLYLLPGFIIVFIVSMQIIRYPDNWPLFQSVYQNAHDTIMLENKFPMDFWHFFYMLILTWRGIRFGREPASSDMHQKVLIWFFIFFVILQVFIGENTPAQYPYYLILTLFLGLAGMPAARIITSSMLRGGRMPKVQKDWIVIILVSAAGFLLLGLLSSFLMNLSVAKVLSSLLISLFTAIVLLVFLLLTPLAYAFMFFFERVINNLMAGAEMPEISVESGQETLNQVQEQTQEMFHQNALSLQNYLIIAATIALIFYIWYTLKQRGYQHHNALSFEEGTIGDRTKKPHNERDLRSLRDRLNLPGSYGLSAIRIRWIYANLCRYGKQLGSPRPAAITPFEYQENLYRLFPENTSEISEITNAYVAVRYGQVPENPDEIKKLQESWEVLENLAQQFLKSKKKVKKQAKKKR
jgi:uncharacterized membrane protein YbhN (UPF0104 family)